MIHIKSPDERSRAAQVQIISGRNLDATLIRAWDNIRLANPEISSPYFAPEFTQIASAMRDGVEIAVISTEAGIAAFFPFHREQTDPWQGAPVADFLSDWEGLICRPGFICDPLELIRECGLVRYDLRRFLGSQKSFASFHQSCESSAQIDLSQGYEAYVKEKQASGSSMIKNCANLVRRMEREIGPLRFVANSGDPEMLRQVLALKSAQYLRTGLKDLFAIEWVRKTIERIHATQTEEFAGMLSLLYAGDWLVAGHFGMRSRTVWHYWFPAYDPEMAKYSPGLNLALKMAAYAPSAGLSTIELGRLRAEYKRRLMNRDVLVACGSVDCRVSARVRSLAKRLWRQIGLPRALLRDYARK